MINFCNQKKIFDSVKCPNCNSNEVSCNGTYEAINYFLKLLCMLAPFLNINYIYVVQKYVCQKCNKSFRDTKQEENLQFRNMIQLCISKLILTLRFKLGVSVRGISEVIKTTFGVFYSIGYIDNICKIAGNNALIKMNQLNYCNQKISNVLEFDETFPKAKEKGCINLGVATCEHGLIRKVQTIDLTKKAKELKCFFKNLITDKYNPKVFLSDYELSYSKAIKKISPNIVLLKDFVHTVRQIRRDCKSVINKINVTFGKSAKITKIEHKQTTKLKRRLLLKQVNKVVYTMMKGFKSSKCGVGTIYLEGGLEDLMKLSIQFKSLKPLCKKVSRFVRKYIDTWTTSMELYSKGEAPLTSNIVESKNAIFKAFSKKAKSYSLNNIDKFFNVVALMENFDIKTRGVNKGTNAMMRAGIDLDEFGANNFFEAIGLADEVKINIKSDYFSKSIHNQFNNNVVSFVYNQENGSSEQNYIEECS